MNRPTVYDFMESHAKNGHTDLKLNLYPRKERELLNGGFSVQRLGPVEGYPHQHKCKVGWADAVEGTVARRFWDIAVTANPKLLELTKDDASDPVPPPYSSGGGWDQP